MADEQRMWSQRHAHESSTISYGQFGTPVYHESSHTWEFPRKDGLDGTHNEDADEQEDGRRLLEILTGPEVVIRPKNTTASDSKTRIDRSQVKDFPDLAVSSSLIKTIDTEKIVGVIKPHAGSRIAFGSALSLSADGVDSGNLVIPIIAYVTGLGGESLRLACLGQERIQHSTRNDPVTHARVPSLIGDPQVSRPGTEPILQLSFSQRNVEGHGDTFLLVRRASHTSIFEPLLRRGTFHAPGQRSSVLDPNVLVTLHTPVTGGHSHVDAAFNPIDHRKIAIVDAEGNWSIWKIRGRRSTTARVLYQARLRTFGKIFSWQHRKRPAGVGLFYDGWHKVIWVSSDGHEIDRLLVCNRQTVKLFDLSGQELQSVDARLDLGKASYVLDVQLGPRMNICLILTTSKLLVFDIGQQEWKDPVSNRGPALLCAFEHFQNSARLSLKATDVQFGDDLLLALYSTDLHRLSTRQLTFQEVDGKVSMAMSDAFSIALPIQTSDAQVAAVLLASTEIAYPAGQTSPHQEALLRIIVQHEDLSVHSCWATAKTSSSSGKSTAKRHLLRLPPNPALQRKSGLRVDDTDNEDDDDGFIVSDGEEEDALVDGDDSSPQSASTITLARPKGMKYISEIYDEIVQQCANNVSKSITNTAEISKKLESRLQDLALSIDTTPGCLPLSELLDDDTRIVDVEAESKRLQHTFSSLDQNVTGWRLSSCHGSSAESLMSTYNMMFDVFINGLSSSVPDRSRVQKERQYRSIALEQYLSRYTTHHVNRQTKAVAEKSQAVSQASQMVFSDPLQHDDPESQRFQQLSASQPLPQTRSDSSNKSAVPSVLLDSLARLRSYTRITRDLDEHLTQDTDILNHFSSILSHLPTSCEEKPDNYNYQDRVMANAAEKAEVHRSDVQSGSRAQRKAARLSRIRNRAEDLTSGLHGGEPNTHSGTVDKESGNVDRGVDLSGQRSQDKDTGSLPIRSSGGRFPGRAWRDKVAHSHSHSQHGYLRSDGHVPAESSSQAGMPRHLTATQPERGLFANRVEAKGQDKAKKKKKKRIAGF